MEAPHDYGRGGQVTSSPQTQKLSRQEAEDFLFREAALLDDMRLDEWLELFTDDATYWIPEGKDDLDPKRETSILYDDRFRMEDRVWRLVRGPAHAQIPPSRTRRMISNVEVEESEDGEVVVYSNFAIFEVRRNEQRIFAGRYEHRLRLGEDALRIRRKKAMLVNNASPLYNLTFMV
nr:aromatic-ring-hydroxylating dioxygenase subunit beta [Rubrobacter marinus]